MSPHWTKSAAVAYVPDNPTIPQINRFLTLLEIGHPLSWSATLCMRWKFKKNLWCFDIGALKMEENYEEFVLYLLILYISLVGVFHVSFAFALKIA